MKKIYFLLAIYVLQWKYKVPIQYLMVNTIENFNVLKILKIFKINIETFRREVEKQKSLLNLYEVSILCWLDDDFPKDILKGENPPLVLFYKGDLSLLFSGKITNVIGTEKISNLGLEITTKLLVEEVNNKRIIASDIKKGIEIFSINTAISMNGRVVAFPGSVMSGNSKNRTENKMKNSMVNKIIEKDGLVISHKIYDDIIHPFDYKKDENLIYIADRILVTQARDDDMTINLVAWLAYELGKEIYIPKIEDIIRFAPDSTSDYGVCKRLLTESSIQKKFTVIEKEIEL